MKNEIIVLCSSVRNSLPKQHMLRFDMGNDNIYKQHRYNPFSSEHSNIVTNSDGKIVMEDGFFGKSIIELFKLFKHTDKKILSFREAVWFYIPADTIVPNHIDENYGGIKRNRDHLTVGFGDKYSTITIDNVVCPFNEVVFCPSTATHGAYSGKTDMWAIQLPYK